VDDGISIFDVIKRGGYEASLITTFNATLPFYEEVVLRKLVGAGCRHNVVLMDRRQCAAAWESEASRPRLAGFGYTLLPVGVSGAFHPKVCILAGPKKASVLIGSHNLTLSGFGYNREITNWIEIGGPKDTEGAAVLSAAWTMVRNWIELERGSAPDVLLESALAIANFVGPLIATAGEQTSTAALAQTPGGNSLLDQLTARIARRPKQIAAIGAFFDQNQTFLSRLQTQWPSARIIVGIDPETVQHPGAPLSGDLSYVDARALWPDGGGYLHAKAIYFESETPDGDAFVCGSANPSRPAWMADSSGGNVESVLLRIGRDARGIAEQTGIDRLFALPAITSLDFDAIAKRNKVALENDLPSCVPIVSGAADADHGLIHITLRNKSSFPISVVLLGPNLEALEIISGFDSTSDSLVLKPSVDLASVRSCLLESDGIAITRVMVVHPSILASNSRSSKQYQIRSALGALGSSDGDISAVIRTVERVIFADETTREVEVAIREHQERRAKQAVSAGPETLAISVNDMARTKRKQRLLKSGDLAYLIDVLLRRLSEGLETQTMETDKAGRTEEEQIGKEDNDATESDTTNTPLAQTTLTDRQIAELVLHRAGTLIRRMVKQLELASKDDSRKASAVMQLVAVLALVRELRHLDKQKRWRSTGLALVDEKDRRHLLDESVKYLFGGRTPLVDVVDKLDHESSEESIQLRVLLAWLAWDVGDELTDQFRRIFDASELKAKLKANALFLKLMPTIAADESATTELHESIAKTIKPSPSASLCAAEWMRTHIGYGKAWLKGTITSDALKVGGYCRLTDQESQVSIVFEIHNGIVGFWDFERVKQFEAKRVTAVEQMAIDPARG